MVVTFESKKKKKNLDLFTAKLLKSATILGFSESII
jgi:hypothetical protein